MSSSISDELAKRAGKSADRDADTSEGERIRLEELHSYAILDTPPEARFDELARLAALVCKTPIAAISLLDEHRQWFKATVGLPMEADIPVAFCKHAIAQSGVYQIENTETHSLCVANPLVAGDPLIRFYASVPLATPKGTTIGMLMVGDHVSRRLTEEQQDALAMLGRQVMVALELHRQRTYLQKKFNEQSADQAILYELATDVPDVCFWSKERRQNDSDEQLLLSSEARAMLGVDAGAQTTVASLAPHVELSIRPDWQKMMLDLPDRTHESDLQGEWTLPDGETRWLRWLVIRKTFGDILSSRLLGLVIDMTQEKHVEEEAAQTIKRLKFAAALLNQANDAICVKNLDHRIEFWSAGAERLYGWTGDEAVGSDEVSLLQEDADAVREICSQLAAHDEYITEIVQRRKDGTSIEVLAHFTRVHDDKGQPRAIFAIFTDITQSRLDQQRIHQLAYYDQLTQLPNRTLLMDRLNRAIASAHRHHQYAALIFIDLDNFKDINDTLGHAVGDELLRQVAARLQASVRALDTVARLGGDEFVVLLEELGKDATQAALQADIATRKISSAIRQPFTLGAHVHPCTSSIGVSLFQGGTGRIDELLKQADIAMYEAKQAGRDDIRFFDPSMQRMVNERVLMENALRNAAIDDEFILHYQPQWYRDGSLAGFEALVRWNHPTRGLLEPAEFIPLAEETGVILSLGRWVLEHACRQIAQWSASNPGIRVAVNISVAQLRNPEFVDEVRQALRHHATSPDCLSLELTESMLIHDLHLTIRTMDELKAMGVRIALDDFGTGYSSLSLLQILPLDYLKIDSSFVHRMEKGLRESRMVQSIVSIAKNLELDIIAEGVETEKQQALLETFGCDEFQGFLRGRSMPASEASRLLHLH